MDKNNKSDYAVGYKKPPRHAQFKAGQSGNSKGRPKKSATFADVLEKQLRKKVPVTTGNKVQRIRLLDAIAMKHISKAANGDPKSTAIILSFLKPDGNDQGNHLPELVHEFRSIHARLEAGERASHGSIDVGGTGHD